MNFCLRQAGEINYCLRQYELLSRKRLNMNYRLRRYELFAKGECRMHNAELSATAGRGERDFPATSIVASFPQSQWSQLHTVEVAPFRLTSPLTEFQPLAALRGSPWSALAACFGKDSRAHRGRNSRLAHRARQDSASFRLRRQRTALTFSSLPTRPPAALVRMTPGGDGDPLLACFDSKWREMIS